MLNYSNEPTDLDPETLTLQEALVTVKQLVDETLQRDRSMGRAALYRRLKSRNITW